MVRFGSGRVRVEGVSGSYWLGCEAPGSGSEVSLGAADLPFCLLLLSCGDALPATACPLHLQHTGSFTVTSNTHFLEVGSVCVCVCVCLP